MNRRSFYRGIFPPVLFIFLLMNTYAPALWGNFTPPLTPSVKGSYVELPLTPAPSPREEGKGKSLSLSPSLFTGEGLGVGDTAIISNIPTLNRLGEGGLENPVGEVNTLYATLGPEAPSILRVLVGDQGFVVVEPGHLAD